MGFCFLLGDRGSWGAGLSWDLGTCVCVAQGKGLRFHSVTASKLIRGVIPKLVFLTLIMRVSDPGAPSSSWRKLQQSQEFEQPFVT